MKQLRRTLPMDGIVDTIEDRLTDRHASFLTDSRLPIGRPAQHRTTAPEFIVRRAASANTAGKFLLDRCNDRALWTATRPVLLRKGDGRVCYRKILVPIDFTEAGRIAAEFAIGCFPYAQIVFLHAFQGPENPLHNAGHASGDIRSQRLSYQEKAVEKLVRLTDELRLSDNLVSRVAHYGSAFSVIVNYAAKMDADLVLFGPQKPLCLKDLLFGSAASRIANCTNADVLVVPHPLIKHGISPATPNGTKREDQRILPALSSHKL